MTFFDQFLVFQTKPYIINVFEPKNLFMIGSKLVLGGPRNAKNSDFVKDILQKSTFQAIRISDLVKTTSGPLLGRVEPPNEAHGRIARKVHKPWFSSS